MLLTNTFLIMILELKFYIIEKTDFGFLIIRIPVFMHMIIYLI